MNKMNFVLSILLVSSLVVTAPAQRRKGQRTSVRVLKNQPTIYITFERRGKLEPLRNGESGEYIWLRLHNNSRWLINLEAGGAPKEYGDAVLFHGVEPQPKGATSIDYDRASKGLPPEDCNITIQAGCHSCSIIHLRPKESILFIVPREYLCGNLKVYIPFGYEWEGDDVGGSGPQHRVYFFGSDLPKEAG